VRRDPRRRALRSIVTGAFLVCAGAFAAGPAGAQALTQCPPVGADTGCQFLIVVTDAGATVQQDSTQGPYEASDDSLIGVQNNSSRALAALPLSAPGLIAVSVFTFTGAWNELLLALILTTSPDIRTIPVALQYLITGDTFRWGLIMAGSVASALPVMILYYLAQRFVVQGLAAGSVKG